MVSSILRIHALVFGQNPHIGGFVPEMLECKTAFDLLKVNQSRRPVIYVVSDSDLSQLRRLVPPVLDKGVKNRHKGLSEYLLGLQKDSIPMIDGNYISTRQLERSVRTFLLKARDHRNNNLFIIGAKKDVFDELWLTAHDVPVTQQKRHERGKRSHPDIDDADETISGLLKDLWNRCEVPAKLEEKFVGQSWKMDLVRRFIMLATERDTPVLIQGETGTGKEIVARAIHQFGPRSDKPYYAINCAGIPSELLEVELFGYMPGCFSGANPRGKIGLWELADKGTLFLDEIGEMPTSQQAKILRTLESGTIRRLCGEDDIRVNARIIAATNRDLSSMIKMGQFREDLYYRLRGIPIHTPSLKDHPDDVPLLAEHFWEKITYNHKDAKSPHAPRLSRRILSELQLYRWPGNARELKMVLNNLYTLCGSREVKEKDLRRVFYWQGQSWSSQSVPVPERGIDLLRGDCWRHLRRADEVIRAAQYDLAGISADKKPPRKAVAAAQAYLEFHLGELEILCRERMLFHTEKTYNAVLRFRESLRHFRDLLQEDVYKARDYWKESLAVEFDNVISLIFREGEKVLGGR